MTESTVVQRSLAQVQRMKAEEIDRALKAGELDDLLHGHDPGDSATPLEEPEQITLDELNAMSPEQVAKADKDGKLQDLLGRA